MHPQQCRSQVFHPYPKLFSFPADLKTEGTRHSLYGFTLLFFLFVYVIKPENMYLLLHAVEKLLDLTLENC